MRITFFNPETANLEKSFLSNPYAISTTSIEVKNNNRFAANDRIMVGEMGQEKTEVVTVTSVNANGTTVVVGATVFSHEADTPVYNLRFDSARFYRSTTTSTGAYTLLSTQALDVDNADLSTIYDDSTGTSAYYYKTKAYHSTSTLESDFSDPMKGAGWLRNQIGYVIDEILEELGDINQVHMTSTELLGYFNDVNDDLTVNVSKPYSFLHSRSAHTRTLNRNYMDFPTDSDGNQTMWKFDRMDYNFTDTTTDPDTDETTTLTVIPMEEFRNKYTDNTISSTTVDDDPPVAMTLDTSVKRFRFSHPAETTVANVFYLHYWKFFTRIDSEGDVLETPTAKIYKLYSKGMYYRKRGTVETSYNQISDRYFADYNIEKAKLKQVDRIDKGSPRSFRPVNATVRGFRL